MTCAMSYELYPVDGLEDKLSELCISYKATDEDGLFVLKGSADNLVKFAHWAHYNIEGCTHSFSEEDVLDVLENCED